MCFLFLCLCVQVAYKVKIERELQRILSSSSSFSTKLCLNSSSYSIDITTSFCSSVVDGATVFFGKISTSDSSDTHQLIVGLEKWFYSSPALLLDGIPYILDLECGLVLQADTQFECGLISTPTLTPPVQWKTALIVYVCALGTIVVILISIVLMVAIIRICWKVQSRKEKTASLW